MNSIFNNGILHNYKIFSINKCEDIFRRYAFSMQEILNVTIFITQTNILFYVTYKLLIVTNIVYMRWKFENYFYE